MICILFKDGVYEVLQYPSFPSSSVVYSQGSKDSVETSGLWGAAFHFIFFWCFYVISPPETGAKGGICLGHLLTANVLTYAASLVCLQKVVFTSKMTSSEGQIANYLRLQILFEPQ